MSRAASTIYVFGRFQLDLSRRELTAAGARVALSSRALDVLQLLVEHRDRVVTKDEIMSAVWRGSIVEDNNLAVQISALRRAVEQRPGQPALIVTVPGRGYRFVADVQVSEAAKPPAIAQRPVEGVPDPEPSSIPALQPATMAPRSTSRVPSLRAAGLSAVLFLVCTMLYAPLRNWLRPREAPRLSIVVMPFRNLTGDARQDYLADAVSDDLTTDLSHIPGSLVIARETADTYKGRAVPANDIGRALNVRYMMEGSLSQNGGTVHINAQLIDTATSGHLWADMFDVGRDKIGEAQFAIVRHIANALNYTLVDVESARAAMERPDSPNAADLYLRARSVLDRDTSMAGLRTAKMLLQKAVAIDADYADALALLGQTLLVMITINDPNEVSDFALAKTAVAHAVAMSPRNPRVIAANGYALAGSENCTAAIPQFELAVQIEPGNIDARAGLGDCQFRLGRPAAMLQQLEAIQRIDPERGRSGRHLEKLGMCYLFMGQPSRAADELNSALAQASRNKERLSPSLGWEEWANLWSIAAYAELGNLDRARELYASYAVRWPNRSIWRMGAYATRATSQVPAVAAYEAALQKAGMPDFAPEAAQDEFVSDASVDGDFRSTPMSLPGGELVMTDTVSRLVEQIPPVAVFDIGRGAATIPSAVWIGDEDLWRTPRDLVVEKRTRGGKVDYDSPLIIMSEGPFGRASYDQARQLVSLGFRSVMWYRGGEERWFASKRAYKDRRPE